MPALVVVFAVAADFERPSAFPLPPAAGELSIRATASRTAVAFDDDGVRVDDDGDLARAAAIVDVDVGIGRGLSLHATLPLIVAHHIGTDGTDGAVDSAGGFGDGATGLGLVVVDHDAYALAVRGDVKVPLYRSAGIAVRGRAPTAGRRPSDVPVLGDGQVDATVSGVFSAAFPFGGSFDFSLGYRLRTGDVSDAVVGAGAIRVPVLDDTVSPGAAFNFVDAFDVDDGSSDAQGAGYVSAGPAVDVDLSRALPGLRLSMGLELRFRAQNTVGGPVMRAGVSYAF